MYRNVSHYKVAVYRLVGPWASQMISTYKRDSVCITGALLATGGLLAASFVNDILLLILSYSIVTGLGFSLMYIPSVVSCVTYFNKRQSLAIGVCLCGSGFGTFSLAPIVQVILENWGWRWVMWALSALSFLGVLCGATMIPISPSSQTSQRGHSIPQEPYATRYKNFNRILSLVLGEVLVKSSRLGCCLLFVLTDILSFASVFIAYTHLPTFATNRYEIWNKLLLEDNLCILEPRSEWWWCSICNICWRYF